MQDLALVLLLCWLSLFCAYIVWLFAFGGKKDE